MSFLKWIVSKFFGHPAWTGVAALATVITLWVTIYPETVPNFERGQFGETKSINAGEKFQVKLVDIKTFHNSKEKKCNTDGYIFLRETYELNNTEIKNITAAHWANTGLYIYKKEYKVKGTNNNLVFEYCIPKKYKSDVLTRFINSSGTPSNVISFNINTENMKIHDPSERLPLEKIK